jgi:hypothetical protein
MSASSRDASGSCFDHNPASDSTNQPLPVPRLGSRESLDQPVRRASAPQTVLASTFPVGGASKFLSFQMIANCRKVLDATDITLRRPISAGFLALSKFFVGKHFQVLPGEMRGIEQTGEVGLGRTDGGGELGGGQQMARLRAGQMEFAL